MLRIYLKVICVVMFSVFIFGCSGSKIHKDMAILDKAYVPAIALTKPGVDHEVVKMAVSRLQTRWEGFSARYATMHKDDPQWSKSFDDVRDMVSEGLMLVDKGDVRSAHIMLEGIRDSMLNLRKKYVIKYIMDDLTEFHTLMENVDGACKDENISTGEMAMIQDSLPEMKLLWERVAQSRTKISYYNLDKLQLKEMKKYIVAQRKAIVTLEEALAKGEQKTMIEAACGVKPLYAKTFKLFGDFSGLL